MFNWLITRRLERIGKRVDPDPAFVRALEQRIRTELAHARMDSRRSLSRAEPRDGNDRGQWSAWKLAAGSLTSVSLIFAGTGAYAYTSDDVLPDTPLYPVRIALEQAEERIASVKPTWRAETQVKSLNRRLKEREIMARNGKPVSQEQTREFLSKVESAIETAEDVPEQNRQRIDEQSAEIEAQYTETLVKEREKATEPSKKKEIDEIIRKQTEKLNDKIEKMPEKRKASFKRIQERQKEILERRRSRTQNDADGQHDD